MGHKMIKRPTNTNPVEKKTSSFIDEFKGNPLYTIWEVDDDNHNVSDKPIVSFGKVKAKLIIKHLEELKEFVKE